MRYILLPFVMLIFFSTSIRSQNLIYENRKTAYIDTALSHFSTDALVLQAYRGVPLDSAALQLMLDNLTSKTTSDFDITKLIRVLFLSSGQYDGKILPVINDFKYWVNKGDTMRDFWTENHMIMWMSADFLLKQKYNRVTDAHLENRLNHYLDTKLKYGFYEFFSSVYAPYALSGLMNLADFSSDTVIRDKARLVSKKLIKSLLLQTNDKGVFYPTAGRNYVGKYFSAYNQNHNSIIFLTTGLGEAPSSASMSGSFIATSFFDMDDVLTYWNDKTDTTFFLTHSFDSVFQVHGSLFPVDQTMFLWSLGGYFHPQIAGQTAQLLTDSAMWDHPEFAPFKPFKGLPVPLIVSLSQNFSVASMSTVLCGIKTHVFKHKSITLGSLEDYWKGKVGYQQFPCVANVDGTPIFMASGEIINDWNQRPATNVNMTLPYVQQKHNAALLMYRPENVPSVLPFQGKDVSLYFKESDYDLVEESGAWLLAKKNDSYVAVKRACNDTILGVRACLTNNGQAWALIVGNIDLYGSYANFKSKVLQATWSESWYIDSFANPPQYVYAASLQFDTINLHYEWGKDTAITLGITALNSSNQIQLVPNPAEHFITVLNDEFKENELVNLRIYNMNMQLVSATEMLIQNKQATIQTADLVEGIYLLECKSRSKTYRGKFVKENH